MPTATLLFGGTFDPIRIGHIDLAITATTQLVAQGIAIDEVVFLPSAAPPHKRDSNSPMASPSDRLQMAQLAIESHPFLDGLPPFRVSDLEFKLRADADKKQHPSYTYHTLQALQAMDPTRQYIWLIGMDAAAKLQLWYEADKLCEYTQLAVIGRPNFDISPQQVAEIIGPLGWSIGHNAYFLENMHIAGASSQVRAAIKQERNVNNTTNLDSTTDVSSAVAGYINNKELYQQNSSALCDALVAVLEDNKATDIRIVNDKVVHYADFAILASGTGSRHQNVMAHRIVKAARELGIRQVKADQSSPGWVTVDLFTVVVHLQDASTREYYEIDALWSDLEHIDESGGAQVTEDDPAATESTGL